MTMLNRFRNVVSNVMGGIVMIPQVPDQQFKENGEPSTGLRVKYAYDRPEFLQLTAEEVQVSADQLLRPILVPRDVTRLPWNAGYAEAINAGKSRLNEDQARAEVLFVRQNGRTPGDSKGQHFNFFRNKTKEMTDSELLELEVMQGDPLPFTYFAIFDGHAGTGAALMAVNLLHLHIQEKLSEVRDLILAKRYALDKLSNPHPPQAGWTDKSASIDVDSLVIGALQAAFVQMDNQICKERHVYKITGGSTALVAIFFLGKLYVANAGDCRAVICRNGEPIAMSSDFTPESERQRIQLQAYLKPELLNNEFSHLEFTRRITKKDIGRKVLYRDAGMTGWSLKTVVEDDTKFPLVYGEGKRTRMMATIGVTRGFGDHDLKVYDSDIPIKPFLSPMPEVRVYDVSDRDHQPDDVLLMGSDGLWDVTSNERAAKIVSSSLKQFKDDDIMRYCSAAQDLVMHARGMLKKGWRTTGDRPASCDDISVFVIPLHRYCCPVANAESSPTESSSEITSYPVELSSDVTSCPTETTNDMDT